MIREHVIRMVAGILILGSLALGLWINRWWFFLTAFVGLNLLQSSLTNWCLLDDILKKLGMNNEAEQLHEESRPK